MSETKPGSSRSWLEKLQLALNAGEPKNRNQLLDTLREAEQRHIMDRDSLDMIEGVLDVADMRTEDIMIPRAHMVCIKNDSSLSDILSTVLSSKHSRFPVIGESLDEVLGILLAKDLLAYASPEQQQKFNLQDIIREVMFIPEAKRVDILLKDFRQKRTHMAIVVDEYGGTSGLITIEDILEQIVGDIADEHDSESDIYIRRSTNNTYTIKGLTPIETFNEYFHTEYSDEEFDTIGGLITKGFGHLPKRNETLELSPFSFKILHADSRQVHLLQAIPMKPI